MHLKEEHANIKFKNSGCHKCENPKKKILGLTFHGARDLSNWRLAKIENICREKITSRPWKPASKDIVDHLFSFEEARMVYNTFVKFEANEEERTSILHLSVWIRSSLTKLTCFCKESMTQSRSYRRKNKTIFEKK